MRLKPKRSVLVVTRVFSTVRAGRPHRRTYQDQQLPSNRGLSQRQLLSPTSPPPRKNDQFETLTHLPRISIPSIANDTITVSSRLRTSPYNFNPNSQERLLEELLSRIVHMDKDLLILNKPPNFPLSLCFTSRNKEDSPLIELFPKLQDSNEQGAEFTPKLVDGCFDNSMTGLVLFARNEIALLKLRKICHSFNGIDLRKLIKKLKFQLDNRKDNENLETPKTSLESLDRSHRYVRSQRESLGKQLESKLDGSSLNGRLADGYSRIEGERFHSRPHLVAKLNYPKNHGKSLTPQHYIEKTLISSNMAVFSYVALLLGIPKQDSGFLESFHTKTPGNITSPFSNKKFSCTYYKILSYNVDTDISMVELIPLTKFPGQLRRQTMDILACPILGDVLPSGSAFKEKFEKLVNEDPENNPLNRKKPIVYCHLRRLALPSLDGKADHTGHEKSEITRGRDHPESPIISEYSIFETETFPVQFAAAVDYFLLPKKLRTKELPSDQSDKKHVKIAAVNPELVFGKKIVPKITCRESKLRTS